MALVETGSGIDRSVLVVERFTICHSVVVHVVGCRAKDDTIAVTDGGNLVGVHLAPVGVGIVGRATHDGLGATRHQEVLALVEQTAVVGKVHEFILTLSVLCHGQYLAEGICSGFAVAGIVGAHVVVRAVHHEWAAGIEGGLAKIGECPYLVGTEGIVTLGRATRLGVVPVHGEQLCGSAEVGNHVVGTLLIAHARQLELLVRIEGFGHVGQASPVGGQLEIEPGAEEEQLSLDEVALFLRGIGEQSFFQSLQTDVGLTDGIPAAAPKCLFVVGVIAGADDPVAIQECRSVLAGAVEEVAVGTLVD